MNCKQCKSWVTDAVVERLSTRRRLKFEAHIRECAKCREEFEQARTLLEAIDRGVMAQATAQPAPDFVTRVRRRIAAETAPAQAGWLHWAPAAAAVAIVLTAGALWITRPKNAGPRRIATMAHAINQPVAANHSTPPPANVATEAKAEGPEREPASLRPVKTINRPRNGRGPEVLVPSGQGKALLQFAALLQSGKIDGTKLVAEQQEAGQLIEIKPLVIAPLESSAEEGNKSQGPGSNGTQKEFVSGTPLPSLLP